MLEKNFYNIKSLKKYKIIFGFFNRKNGFSKKNYKSLNCSFSSGDKKNLVKKNINQSLKKISLYNKKLIIPIQTHSSKIKKIKSYNIIENIEADGLLTNNRKIALAVLTADCAPIMLFDKNEKIICCLHSGWRGSLNNIAGKGVKQLIKNKIKKNDIILAIPSSGLHSNGFSLVRHILKKKKTNKLLKKIKDELIKPTKIYVKEVNKLSDRNLINGCANITGGGLLENLGRIIPKNFCLNINLSKIRIKSIFKWLKRNNISESEMIRTFNCGIGFCLLTNKKNIKYIKKFFSKKYQPYEIGYVSKDIPNFKLSGKLKW